MTENNVFLSFQFLFFFFFGFLHKLLLSETFKVQRAKFSAASVGDSSLLLHGLV